MWFSFVVIPSLAYLSCLRCRGFNHRRDHASFSHTCSLLKIGLWLTPPQNSQARVEETALARVLHDGPHFPLVQPDTLAARTNVNLRRSTFLRRQLLAAFRAVHPVGLLHAEFVRFRFCLLFLGQFGHPLLHFLHPNVLIFSIFWFHGFSTHHDPITLEYSATAG